METRNSQKSSQYHVVYKVSYSCAGGIIGAITVMFLLWLFSPTKSVYLYTGPVRDNFADLMLTLVTASLAGIGIMIALVAAVIGWASLRVVDDMKEKIKQDVQKEIIKEVSDNVINEARKMAKEQAIDKIRDIQDDKDFVKLIGEIVARVAYGGPELQHDNSDPELEDDLETNDQKRIGEQTDD